MCQRAVGTIYGYNVDVESVRYRDIFDSYLHRIYGCMDDAMAAPEYVRMAGFKVIGTDTIRTPYLNAVVGNSTNAYFEGNHVTSYPQSIAAGATLVLTIDQLQRSSNSLIVITPSINSAVTLPTMGSSVYTSAFQLYNNSANFTITVAGATVAPRTLATFQCIGGTWKTV